MLPEGEIIDPFSIVRNLLDFPRAEELSIFTPLLGDLVSEYPSQSTHPLRE